MHRALTTITLLLASLLLPACWSHHAARPRTLATAQHATPPAHLPADAWPARSTEPLQTLYDNTPDKVFSYRIAEGVKPDSLTDQERALVESPAYTVKYKGFHANLLLRIYATPDDLGQKWDEEGSAGLQLLIDTLYVGFSPNARAISSRTLEGIARRDELARKMAPPEPASDTPQPKRKEPPRVEYITDAARLRLDEGLPLRIPAPASTPPKGLVIHLQSLGGNEFEPKVLQEFRNRNWAIIDIKTQTNITSPVPDAWYEEINKLIIEEREIAKEVFAIDTDAISAPGGVESFSNRAAAHPKYKRWAEVQARLSKLRKGGFDVSREEGLPELATSIASELDQALAGAAYAVEAVLDYVDTQRPDLQNIPVVMLGFSAGALATPTAAARIDALSPGRISAIVLVGGGCNLFRISQESSFTDGGLKLRVGEERAPKATIDKVSELYLKASKLDPYHTAPIVAHIPTLQVHASTDTWVPCACGEILYERLNYPERLVMSGDHDYLFYFLPKRAKWIADWTERAITTK
jgi:hypothetical protein